MNIDNPHVRVITKKHRCRKQTRNIDEYRVAVRMNNTIWSKYYNKYLRAGLGYNEASRKARENVEEYRQRYPFPCLYFGGSYEETKQSEPAGGLVLGGVPEEGTNPEQIFAARLQNAALAV